VVATRLVTTMPSPPRSAGSGGIARFPPLHPEVSFATIFGLGRYHPHATMFGLGRYHPHATMFGLGRYHPHATIFGLGRYHPQATIFGLGRYRPHATIFGLARCRPLGSGEGAENDGGLTEVVGDVDRRPVIGVGVDEAVVAENRI
jgi:hypothetical protein